MTDDPIQPGVTRAPFGMLEDGRAVELLTLTSAWGFRVTVSTLGAALQSVWAADRRGERADVTLGFASPKEYLRNPGYFGATVGRVANRIASARFTLDGREHRMAANEGDTALHGGVVGFDQAVWSVAGVQEGLWPSVKLLHISPDGDQGFPGQVRTTATFSLGEGDELSILCEAVTDAPTLVNLTNHAYWNLGGEGSGTAMDHRLILFAYAFLPVDERLIPTGEVRPVDGTPFDFRTATPIGARIGDEDQQLRIGRGYDHNWIISPPADGAVRRVARLEDPASGRVLELLSDQPGVQFYSGNFLDGSFAGKRGRPYHRGDGVALEPQAFPDTANQPAFGCIRLDPGQTYRHRMVFRFSAGAPA